MWILVAFDLPTGTKKERKAAHKFRLSLLKDGFNMLQFSIYTRPCSSRENMRVHINRVKKLLPEYGKIGIFNFTDKQFSQSEQYFGKKSVSANPPTKQLSFF